MSDKQDKFYVVDVDGTLYFHTPVRLMMIFEMMWYMLFHLNKYKDILLIYKYRKYHKHGTQINHFDFAQKNQFDVEYVNRTVNEWMILRPLKWIRLFADKKLISFLSNKKVIYFSDYPTEQKLQCLNLSCLGQYYCDNINIIHHKPSPEGLEYISNKHGLQKKDMYVIGDRYSHDGLCAENFGCNYLILSKYRIFRMWQYRKIL